MKTLHEWQKAFVKAANKKFPNNQKWSQQDRVLAILRQLADVSGAIQKEQGLLVSTNHVHEDSNHRIAALVADILLLCEQRGISDKELEGGLSKVLKWYEGKE